LNSIQDISRDQYITHFERFPRKYRNDFDSFWRWKLSVENIDDHILDSQHVNETYVHIVPILRRWQYFKNSKNHDTFGTLRIAFSNIAPLYTQLKKYSLLNFDDIEKGLLEKIWHELGRCKEENGNINEYGEYSAIAVCKPLMLLWGQTLAFDSNVRENMKRQKLHYNWSFERWYSIMNETMSGLRNNQSLLDFFKHDSNTRYLSDTIIPYGRYLDIYFFSK
jgi:hypothetical protein